MSLSRRLFILCSVVAISGCGSGEDSVAAWQNSVSFYGDSITAGRTLDIAAGLFVTQDFAIPAQSSKTPLSKLDNSRVVVIRYGMADLVFSMPPETILANITKLVAEVRALGKVPVVVNVSYTESGMEVPLNNLLRDITDIDVSVLPVATVDGIHPTEEYHLLLNDLIRSKLVPLINSVN